MRLPHRLQGQKVKSQGHGAVAYCGGHLAAQLVKFVYIIIAGRHLDLKFVVCRALFYTLWSKNVNLLPRNV